MKKPNKLQSLYNRSGNSTANVAADPDLLNGVNGGPENGGVNGHHQGFPKPSIFQRARLRGVPLMPNDMYHMIRMVIFGLWSLVRLHCIELPYHLVTGFKNSSKQHPKSWAWPLSAIFSVLRTATLNIRSAGQIRFIGFALHTLMPLQLYAVSNVKRKTDVRFKVKRDVLTRPERATLFDLRENLRANGFSDDPLNPSQEYLESMHPKDPNALANLPEEIETLDSDGTYTLNGEWMEVLEEDPKNNSNPTKPRSNAVILYFHGGGHVFCSAKSPFPASIHDAYAAYLYLTEPTHAALVLDEDSAADELAVDPRDIVVGGDSAGGNLALAFMMYMTQYVQPSTEPKFILPHATLLLSPWVDSTSSMPAAGAPHTYCYTPSFIGSSPFDEKAYFKSHRPNFTSSYLCGDPAVVLNSRNAMGDRRIWEWYSHLAQHPLVTPVFASDSYLKGLTNTLVQVGSFERLVDEDRLLAHRIGLQNPHHLTRIENYKDMMHVHQLMFLFLHSGRIATKNLARFIERSEHLRDEREKEMQLNPQNFDAVNGRPTYAFMLRKHPIRKDSKMDIEADQGDEYMPAYRLPSMVQVKATVDGVEWILVGQDGYETAGDEGLSLQGLMQTWPGHSTSSVLREE
ncbi:hypothetical protein BGZ76_003601 [Entomortierella beljakovae]|nr:hypothetical protein BGZ76_003601 [Entomortierella beljakovae]